MTLLKNARGALPLRLDFALANGAFLAAFPDGLHSPIWLVIPMGAGVAALAEALNARLAATALYERDSFFIGAITPNKLNSVEAKFLRLTEEGERREEEEGGAGSDDEPAAADAKARPRKRGRGG